MEPDEVIHAPVSKALAFVNAACAGEVDSRPKAYAAMRWVEAKLAQGKLEDVIEFVRGLDASTAHPGVIGSVFRITKRVYEREKAMFSDWPDLHNGARNSYMASENSVFASIANALFFHNVKGSTDADSKPA